jgi:hypothetical protein
VGVVDVEAVSYNPANGGSVGSSAKSDSSGNFRITSLPPGTYSVGIVESGVTDTAPDWAQPRPITVTTSLDKPCAAPNIVLTTGSVVTGLIVDSKTNKPVSGVYVSIDDGSPGETRLFRHMPC